MTSNSVSNSIRAGFLVLGFLLFSVRAGFAVQGFPSPLPRIDILSLETNPPDPRSLKSLQELGIAVGKPYDPLAVKKGIEKLYATGAFRDVRVEGTFTPDGIALVYVLSYRQFFSRIELRGNRVLRDATLREALLGAGIRVNKELVEASLGEGMVQIQRLYQDAGYFRADIVAHLHPSRVPHAVMLEIHISERERTKIRSLSFAGDKVFSESKLLSSICSFGNGFRCSMPGEYYSRAQLENDVQRLLRFYEAQGYLEAAIDSPKISYRVRTNEVDIALPITLSNRIRVVFKGVPAKRAFPWSLSGTPRDEARLRELLLIREEHSDDEGVLQESARRMEAFYRAKGYLFAEVTVQRQERPAERVVEITFLIVSGPHVAVREIQIEGNRGISTPQLAGALALRKGDDYLPDRLPEEAEKLMALYRLSGFLRPEVEADTLWNEKKDGVTLTFRIKEGVQTRISGIILPGATAFPQQRLRHLLRAKEGDPFVEANLKEDQRTLINEYHRMGYLHAAVEPSMEMSADRRAVVISYQINEGTAIRMRNLVLEGNKVTRSHLIRRELLIHSGDPLDLERVLESQKRLYRLGIFSEVHFETVSTPDPSLQDLYLSVKERPAGAFEFGFGYADFERFRGFVQLSQGNLFGTGRSISLRVDESRIEQRYGVDYKEPWVFSRDITGRLGFAYARQEEVSFKLNTWSGTIGIEKIFTDRLKGLLLYEYDHAVTSDVQFVVNPEDVGRYAIGSLNPSLIFDNRDDPFNPTRGWFANLTVRDAAKILASQRQFVKGTVQLSRFLLLFPHLVLAVSSRGGMAREFGVTTEVPISERYLLGGRSTVRGYDQDRLGVPGETLQNGNPTGGNAFVVFNEELRISLPASIGFVLFFDHGNVWPTAETVRFGQIKSTTGAGLRYNTPVGPLRLDWGYKLNREPGEDAWAIHFTLGHAF